MNWIQALILGIIQGLTEYLPVSSSGHLAIGQALFGLADGESNLAFTVLLHVATVLSTLVILWKEIVWIFKDLFTRQSWRSYQGLNDGTKYAINIIISMIPVALVGLPPQGQGGRSFWLGTAHRRHHALGDGLAVDIFLFCQTQTEREHQWPACLHYWYRPSLCCYAWPVALG